MATNQYTNWTTQTNEQDLINDLFAESIKFWGIDVNYIPRTLVKEDLLFNEDTMSSFESNTVIEMCVETTDNYGGNLDFIAKLGLQIDDELELIVSRKRFHEEMGTEPKEGDLIYFPTGKALFEILFVENEQQWYPLGTLPSYKLKTALFKYNQNNMNTGVPEVDEFENVLDLSDTGTDPFSNNDIIEAEADTILDFSEKNPFGDF